MQIKNEQWTTNVIQTKPNQTQFPRPQSIYSAKKAHHPIVFSGEVVAAVIAEFRIRVVQLSALRARLGLCHRCPGSIFSSSIVLTSQQVQYSECAANQPARKSTSILQSTLHTGKPKARSNDPSKCTFCKFFAEEILISLNPSPSSRPDCRLYLVWVVTVYTVLSLCEAKA